MNHVRFTAIIESYGANPDRWPADERDAAMAFSGTHADAAALLNEAAELDQFLDGFKLPEAAMPRIRIRGHRGRPDIIEQFLNWLTPSIDDLAGTLWRPAVVACLPLLLGIAIGIGFPSDDQYRLTLAEEFELLAMGAIETETWNHE